MPLHQGRKDKLGFLLFYASFVRSYQLSRMKQLARCSRGTHSRVNFTMSTSFEHISLIVLKPVRLEPFYVCSIEEIQWHERSQVGLASDNLSNNYSKSSPCLTNVPLLHFSPCVLPVCILSCVQPGFERLCCLRCMQTRDHNFGTTCVCRVPKHLREDKVIECIHCGCRGCASGDK